MDFKDKILVIIPAYNAEKTIAKTIESLLNQTMQSDIIVINDASIDNTINIISKYNIKIKSNSKNIGTYASINEGLKEFNHKGFVIHGADDISIKFRMEYHLNALNKGYYCSIGKMQRYDYNENMIGKSIESSSVTCYSKKVFDILGYFDTNRFGADTEYYYRYRKHFPKALQFKDIMLKAYVNSNNLTSRISVKERQEYISLMTEQNIKYRDYDNS